MDDLYRKLREWMHSVSPGGFPETATGSELELLKYLFTPEEARLALHLSIELKSLPTIAGTSGVSPVEAERILDHLYEQGVIRRHLDGHGKQYAALAFIPGMMENLIFTRGSDKNLLRLIFRTFDSNKISSYHDKTGITRTVPVEHTIPAVSDTAPYQDIVELIKRAPQPILVFPCHCRFHKKDRCDAPLEVCFAFGDHAQFYLDNGKTGRKVDVEEALTILKTAEEAGLVHQFINYTDDDPSWLCNCCRCCCINMSFSNKYFPSGKVRNIDPSAYIASVTASECTGCGLCIERCPVHALELQDNMAAVQSVRCIGCGLCVTECPTEAIKLLKRPADQIPDIPKTWRELIDRQHAAQEACTPGNKTPT